MTANRADGSTPDWSPSSYLKFEDERTRPARDLLAQVPLAACRTVVDVGCGPGNSTALLAERYPAADLLGIDTSPAMIAEARRRSPEIAFKVADARLWTPDFDTDLVFSNATYQWVPDHLEHLVRTLQALRSGAVLAIQMPDNLAEPVHLAMREAASEGPWAPLLKTAARDPLPSPGVYYDALKPHAERVDIWRTTYHHRLADASAIVAFVRSTGLRPFLDPLSEADRDAFLASYLSKVAALHPVTVDGGVLLPFPRLFILAQR